EGLLHSFVALFYAVLFVILVSNRADVNARFEVNDAVLTALENSPLDAGPPKRHFADIRDMNDVLQWLSSSFLPHATALPPRSKDLAVRSKNQIIPLYQSSVPQIRLSVRRAKLNANGNERTKKLFPSVWSFFELDIDSEDKDTSSIESTATIHSSYVYDGIPRISAAAEMANGIIGKTVQGTQYINWPDVVRG
ncbi:unnamed protein product, partial [Amoebophrya sp. A25]